MTPTVLGVITRVSSTAGKTVVEVRADSIAPGYTVGPCEVADTITSVAVGQRVVAVPVGIGSEQYVVVARLP